MDWLSLLAARPLPLVMGILNVTPDSFSDGGRYFDEDAAFDRGLELEREGADILDVGGESTRPASYGTAEEVPQDEEIRRTAPVIRRLAAAVSIPISIDTRKAPVARAALEAGASIVNDVTALAYDSGMAAAVAAAGACAILMHMRGTDPRTMQSNLEYRDLFDEVCEPLAAAAERARDAGVPREKIAIDPGLGFGKSPEQSLSLLARLSRFSTLGLPVAVGASRKRFVRAYSGIADGAPARSTLGGSLACALFAAREGASIVRVHDVAESVELFALSRTSGFQAARREEAERWPEFSRMWTALETAATANKS
jgi:dihydropteroate synthase